jgi:hypothetical protein
MYYLVCCQAIAEQLMTLPWFSKIRQCPGYSVCDAVSNPSIVISGVFSRVVLDF